MAIMPGAGCSHIGAELKTLKFDAGSRWYKSPAGTGEGNKVMTGSATLAKLTHFA